MMNIKEIRDELVKSNAGSFRPVYSVTPVSPNRLYLEILVPGFASNRLRVKSNRSGLVILGSDVGSSFPLHRPTPFSMVFPMFGLAVDSVELADGVLRIAMNLDHEDAEKEYQINIPQPSSHPQYLTEDSNF